MLGQGGGVLIWSPLLQKMIDEFGWRTAYRIMTGVVPVLFLFGITYSPNVENEEVDTGQTAVEEKKKGCHIDVSVWKEPKFVAVCISASVMMFGHYVPQIHLVSLIINVKKNIACKAGVFCSAIDLDVKGRLKESLLCRLEIIYFLSRALMRAKLFHNSRRYFVYNHVFFPLSLPGAAGPLRWKCPVRCVIGCFNRGT